MVERDVVGYHASVADAAVAVGDEPGDGAFDWGPPAAVFVLPGGVGGGLIGNAIGHSNNRADCRRDRREYRRDRSGYYDRDGHRHDYYR